MGLMDINRGDVMEHLKILLALTVLTLFGCRHHEGQNPYVQPAEKPTTTLATKQIAALAFISYAGDSIDAPDYLSNQIIQPCVEDELKRHQILKKQYSLAWGPFVYRFKDAELDDNMMFAAWNTAEPGQLIISIRGTNFGSVSDWIGEDFYVTKTVEWKYANPINPDARISEATNAGLTVLQNLGKSNSGKTTLGDFVAEHAVSNKLSSIVVTGHSLAGALAPVYALWLKDTQQKWDPNYAKSNAVEISVLPIAGASPGNAEFADYYDSQLKETTTRLHNPYDVVPQAWYLPTMHEIRNIYATPVSDYRPSTLERAALEFGVELSKGKDYLQITKDTPPTWGAINTQDKTFAGQAGWQHHCGYYNALDMNTIDGVRNPMVEVNSYCVTKKFCDNNRDSSMCDFREKVKCPLVPIKPL